MFKKRWVLAVMASALLLTTACGTNNGNGGTQESSSASSGASTAPSSDPVPLKIMGNYDKADLSATDKKVVEMLEQKTNTKITFEIPPMTGYAERLQLMLASGGYPDLVFFPSTTEPSFLNAVKEGIVVPVNDYVKNTENLQKYTYPSSWDALKIKQDDNIYGVPRTSVTRNDHFWVRKDWLDNLNITIPDNSEVTIEEFTEILRKFTNEDPDQNGKDDTYGLATFVNARKVLEPVMTNPFGLLGWQQTSSGSYVNALYDKTGELYKKELAYTNQLFSEGLVDPDGAMNDSTLARERFWRGITGVFPGFAGHYSYHTEEMRKLNPDVELTYVFVKDAQGELKGGGYATGLWGFWAVTSAAKDPQKAVDFLNAYLSDEMWPIVSSGFEGFDYKVENGQKVALTDNHDSFVRRNTMRRAYDTEFFIQVGMDPSVTELMKPWLKKSVDTVVLSKDLGFIPEVSKTPVMMDYQKVWDQTVMRIILGDVPVSQFDELLAGWYNAGGEEYVTEMNEFIKKMESAK
jgi:putative aldouronate transport system substrate-binding protein